jgi:ArsR family transcriptional regulator
MLRVRWGSNMSQVCTVLSAAGQPALVTEDSVVQMTLDLRLVADETRLRILNLLADGEQCVCHITATLGLSQPLASYHLGVLREAELVNDRHDSRWVYYSINLARMREISGGFARLFNANRVRTGAAACAPQRCSEMETRE